MRPSAFANPGGSPPGFHPPSIYNEFLEISSDHALFRVGLTAACAIVVFQWPAESPYLSALFIMGLYDWLRLGMC